MSGGVDSSTAALLLKQQGAGVIGLSMHLWNHDRDGDGRDEGRCCTLDDLATARRAAEKIGIPHYVLNFEEDFVDAVVRPFAKSYLAGETPSPCVACNTDVKFKALLKRALALGCDAVATGHYARIGRSPGTGRPRLLKGKDPAKDQSYFLHGLTEAQLERLVFPLGDLTKPEVRQIAGAAGLPNWNKPDSQEICFVARGKSPRDFILEEGESLGIPLPGRRALEPGEFVDREGRVVGTHTGAFPFTVGQRRGLGLASGTPLYVLELRPEEGQVVVGPEEQLLSPVVFLRQVNWLGEEPLREKTRVLARIRSRHAGQWAVLHPLEGNGAVLHFEEPVRAAAPGQFAVFYSSEDPDWVLGGGVITRGDLGGSGS